MGHIEIMLGHMRITSGYMGLCHRAVWEFYRLRQEMGYVGFSDITPVMEKI